MDTSGSIVRSCEKKVAVFVESGVDDWHYVGFECSFFREMIEFEILSIENLTKSGLEVSFMAREENWIGLNDRKRESGDVHHCREIGKLNVAGFWLFIVV